MFGSEDYKHSISFSTFVQVYCTVGKGYYMNITDDVNAVVFFYKEYSEKKDEMGHIYY